MNKLLAMLIAGTFAAVSTAALAQSPAPAPMTAAEQDKAAKDKAKADKRKADIEREKAAQDLSRNSPNPAEQKANVDASKQQPRTKTKYDEKAQQNLSDMAGTNPSEQKANVAASKAQSAKREKMPDLSKLTKEQKQELYRQLQKEATP